MPSSPYTDLRESALAERTRLDGVSRRLARARAVSFLAGLGAVVWSLNAGAGMAGGLVVAGLLAILLFAGLVVWHARVDDRRDWHDALATVNVRALARCGREWEALPDEPSDRAEHPAVQDLDLAGRASLMQLLGPATSWGRETLERWLLTSAAPDVVRRRQEAVGELAPRLEFRQALAARGLLARGLDRPSIEPLMEWAEREPWLCRRPAVVWTVRVSSVATLVLIAAQAIGLAGGPHWIVPLGVNLLVIAALQGTVHRSLDLASAAAGALGQYARLFELIASTRFEAGGIRSLQETLGGRTPAHIRLRRLDRIDGLASLRRSAAILYFPIHASTLWDFHVLDRVERWQRLVGPRVRGWLMALGELDALCCLAALRHDNPGWCCPEITESDRGILRASGLGHPLIPDGARVGNDLEVGPPGTFLLVTGSNMSGKSTLLRAIGVNVLLAQAGGPACATRLVLPPLSVETSVRVHDSLADGLSAFMAALGRLRAIVEAARDAEREGRRVLFLLDEILQGTNTAERQTATRAIIRTLVGRGAIGALTTHDLGLVEGCELASASQPVHLAEIVDEQAGEVAMRFDYRLRPGLATSRNALRLMRIMGLDPGEIRR